MKFLKNLIIVLICVFSTSVLGFSQGSEWTVRWKQSAKILSSNEVELLFTGKIREDWHIYDTDNEYSATTVSLDESKDFTLIGKPYIIGKPQDLYGDKVFFNEVVLAQKIKLNVSKTTVKGVVSWRACTEASCANPDEWEFSLDITIPVDKLEDKSLSTNKTATSTPTQEQETVQQIEDIDEGNTQNAINKEASIDSTIAAEYSNNEPTTTISSHKDNETSGGSIWGLIIEAILWGFAMLLTPCVFPMVPMTISFFMKGSSSPRAGRFKAFMYGLFIVLLYTVPISLIIGITWLLGGDSVTADIFNWLATHWIPNIIFFIVFMIFAASFFGAFEITLPSSIVNKSDQKADKKGLAGVFFMALTLVLVSFSCTGPIVGSVLIKSTQGEFWTPMVTMLAFSVAFALPFTIFALFPSLLNKLKSGSWLNSVKVVLGFIEVALGFKFLSIPDQTYHWGLLDREVYLAVWIVTFSLLGLYLLGKIRFAHDDKVEKIGVFRLGLVITVFSFVVYMVPGMFGAPLKALSGYLPPLESQDFVTINKESVSTLKLSANDINANIPTTDTQKYHLTLPLGLSGYFTIEEGLAAAKKLNKPVFVDITGHGCTNCREMEARVWSDPKVLNMLKNDFIIVALYTDDKSKLLEEDWITTDNGKVIKDLGRANSYIVRSKFGVNAQPNYVILNTNGQPLVPVRGYNLDVDAFVNFLQNGIDKFKMEQN